MLVNCSTFHFTLSQQTIRIITSTLKLVNSIKHMQLSNEDNLRLNVLLSQELRAIRINESTMTVFALTDKGEAKIVLNPTLRDEQYLRLVRELLSLKITGSPGGYPVFIKRWTRMGHTDNTLEHMLLLGEPEAVVAVVHAKDLNHDIGVRAWWANPTTEVAMRLMEYPAVAQGELGKELSAYLMEFLPFEEVQLNIVNMVRLCLQSGLLSEDEKHALWARAKRRNPFYVGFAHADPAQIPLQPSNHDLHNEICDQLESLIKDDNIFAITLCDLLSKNGQKWLNTLQLSLKKPVDQDVVISLFTAISLYFKLPLCDPRGQRDIDMALTYSDQLCNELESNSNSSSNKELCALINTLTPNHLDLINAMLVLAQLGEHTLIPIFSGNESVGTVMRKRLLPLTIPLLEKIDILIQQPHTTSIQ